MKISKLNKQIFPIYINYKKSKGSKDAVYLLKLWSDIGYYIDCFLKDNPEVSKTKLFRLMYGKSESSDNVGSQGYISREFLQKAHRVYLMERNNQINIENDLKNLKTIAPFREAMPFFDNKKYKFNKEKKENLLIILNSNLHSSKKVNKIRDLQKKYIKISNPRTQRLDEIRDKANNFIKIYKNIYSRIDLNDRLNEDKDNLILLNNYLLCLSTDDFMPPKEKISTFNNKDLDELRILVEFFFLTEHSKTRRRFRRLIPSERIIKLQTMIHKLGLK